VSDPDGDRCHVHFWPDDADVSVDPGHGFEDVAKQLSGDEPSAGAPITMGGFAWNYAYRLMERGEDVSRACDIMGCHSAARVPVLSTLAREFAVCAHWHSSVPSETWPNRLFAHGAQSDGLVENRVRLYDHRSVFDVLNDHRVPWAVYAGDVPQAAAYIEANDAFRDRFNTFGEFLDDVAAGTLPRYSWVEPKHLRKVDSQHPTHSVALGDELLRRVYDALRSNPEIWNSVLLLITYDEHGGFFDREPPPAAVPPNDRIDNEFGFRFDRLGVRVPAVVVSPYVAAGTVDREIRDHACIVRTLFDAFGIDDQLTARDGQAASLLPLIEAAEARTAPTLPAAAPVAARAAVEAAAPVTRVDDLQASLVELATLLDQHRRVTASALEAGVADVEPGDEVLDSQLEQVVERFRERHLGDRQARLRAGGG
jgi:phospholipase C